MEILTRNIDELCPPDSEQLSQKFHTALSKSLAVADPGFPRGGGANPKGGAPTYYLANFSRKLHENEEIWGQGGARVPRAPP